MVVAIGTGSVIHRSYRNLFFFNDTATTEIYTLSLHDALPISGTHRSEYPSACEPRQTDRADADCTGATLDQERTSSNWPGRMNRSMRGDARYAEASALLERNAVRQRYGLRGGHDDILGRSAERAIGLRPVAPHALADSRARDALPNAVDGARSIAVGNHARVRPAVAESVLSLLDVTRIDSGCSDPDTHLAWLRLRVGQRADHENLSGWTLLFVPRGIHPARPLRGQLPLAEIDDVQL